MLHTNTIHSGQGTQTYYLLNLGHKLILNLVFVFMGIHGYSMSIRKKFVGIRSILLKNWEGIRDLGKVFVHFFDFLKIMFEYVFE